MQVGLKEKWTKPNYHFDHVLFLLLENFDRINVDRDPRTTTRTQYREIFYTVVLLTVLVSKEWFSTSSKFLVKKINTCYTVRSRMIFTANLDRSWTICTHSATKNKTGRMFGYPPPRVRRAVQNPENPQTARFGSGSFYYGEKCASLSILRGILHIYTKRKRKTYGLREG